MESQNAPTLAHSPVLEEPKAFRYRVQVLRRRPVLIVGILAVILFTYLIVIPILSLLSDGIRVQSGDERRADAESGAWTAYYIVRVLTGAPAKNTFWIPLAHTLEISVGAIAIALLLGGFLGWLVSRTDLPGRKWFSTALIVPYMVPSWTFAMVWRTIFRNRRLGGPSGWLESVGFEPPNWLAFGQLPITLILAVHYMPFVIILFGSALRNLDSQLEDSARVLGGSKLGVMRRVTLPLMRPSLLSAVTLIFAKCLGDFGVTYIVGVPNNYEVLATSLYRTVRTGGVGATAVLASAIAIIGTITLLVDARLVREGKRFVTMGSKTMARPTPLRRLRRPALLFVITTFVVCVVIPFIVLTLSTVMRVPGKFTSGNFTSDYWIGHGLDTPGMRSGLLFTPQFWAATWNTIWIVGLAAIGAGVLGLFVGYIVTRVTVRGLGGYLRQVTFFPYLVPGIALAAAFLSFFAVSRGPVPALYGTAAILIVALLIDQIPYASRTGISAMMQLGNDPEEAAQIQGAGWPRRMRKIVLPIQRRALVTGSLLPFISGVKGLSLPILLAVPGTDLLTTYTIRMLDFGFDQASNGVVLMLCFVAFAMTYFVQKTTKSGIGEDL